jgi:hypothetical protein
VEKEVKKYLREKNSEKFYKKGISNLRHRWDLCVKLQGSYVET